MAPKTKKPADRRSRASRRRSRRARAAARRAARDGHLPGDDRARSRSAATSRVQALNKAVADSSPDRARHPAPGGPRGHRRPVRAVRRRHAGQDRPGRPAPGRHRPRHRPGPAAPAPARLRRDRAVHPGARRGWSTSSRPRTSRSRRSCAPSRARSSSTSQSGAPVPPEAAVAARNITEPGPAGRHGRLQPGHDHRAAPGAARDDRRRRAPEARLQLPRPARSRSSS